MVIDIDAERILTVVGDNERRIFVQTVNRSYNAAFNRERERLAFNIGLNREGLVANRVNNAFLAGRIRNGNSCVTCNMNFISFSRNVSNSNRAVAIFVGFNANRVAAVVNAERGAFRHCSSAFIDADSAVSKSNFARAGNCNWGAFRFFIFSFRSGSNRESCFFIKYAVDCKFSVAAGNRSASVAVECDSFNAFSNYNAVDIRNILASNERAVIVRADNRRHSAVDEGCSFHFSRDCDYAVVAEDDNVSPDIFFSVEGVGVAVFACIGFSKEFLAVSNQTNASLEVSISHFIAVFKNREGFVEFNTSNGYRHAFLRRYVKSAVNSSDCLSSDNYLVGAVFFIAEVKAYSTVAERGSVARRVNAERSNRVVGNFIDSVQRSIAFFEFSRLNRNRKVSQRENCAVCANQNCLKNAVAFLSASQGNVAFVTECQVSNLNCKCGVNNISIGHNAFKVECAFAVDNENINPLIFAFVAEVNSNIFFSGALGRFENSNRGGCVINFAGFRIFFASSFDNLEQTSRSSYELNAVKLEAFFDSNFTNVSNYAFSNSYINHAAGNVSYSLSAGCSKAFIDNNRAVSKRCRRYRFFFDAAVGGRNYQLAASRGERNAINRRSAIRRNFSRKRNVNIVNVSSVNREVLDFNAVILREGVLARFCVGSQFRKVSISRVARVCAKVRRSRYVAEVNHVLAFEELVVRNFAGECKQVGVDASFFVNVINERRGFASFFVKFSNDNLERLAVHCAGVGLAVEFEGFAVVEVNNAVYFAFGYIDDNAVAVVAASHVGNAITFGGFERAGDNNCTSFENCACSVIVVGCNNRQTAIFFVFVNFRRREGYAVDSSRASRRNFSVKFSRNAEVANYSFSVNRKLRNINSRFSRVGSEHVVGRRIFFIFASGNFEACKVRCRAVGRLFAVVGNAFLCSCKLNRVVVLNLDIIPAVVIFAEDIGIEVNVFDNSRAVNNNLAAHADVNAAVKFDNRAVVQLTNAGNFAFGNNNRDAVGIGRLAAFVIYNRYNLAGVIFIAFDSGRYKRINNRNSTVEQSCAVFERGNSQSIIGERVEVNAINVRIALGYEVRFKFRRDNWAVGADGNLEDTFFEVNSFFAFVLREGVACRLAAFFIERGFKLDEVSCLSVVFRNAVVSFCVGFSANSERAFNNLVVRNVSAEREQVVIAFCRSVVNLGVGDGAFLVGFGNDNFIVNEGVGLAIEYDSFAFLVESSNAGNNAVAGRIAFLVNVTNNNYYAVALRERNCLAGVFVARIFSGCNFVIERGDLNRAVSERCAFRIRVNNQTVGCVEGLAVDSRAAAGNNTRVVEFCLNIRIVNVSCVDNETVNIRRTLILIEDVSAGFFVERQFRKVRAGVVGFRRAVECALNIFVKRNGVVCFNLDVRNRVSKRQQVVIGFILRIIEFSRRADNVAVLVIFRRSNDNPFAVEGVRAAVEFNNFIFRVVEVDNAGNNAFRNSDVDAVANGYGYSLAGIFGAFNFGSSQRIFNRNSTSRERCSEVAFLSIFAVISNSLNRQRSRAFLVRNCGKGYAVNVSRAVGCNGCLERNRRNDDIVAFLDAGCVNRDIIFNFNAAVRIDFKAVVAVFSYGQFRKVGILTVSLRIAVVNAAVVAVRGQIFEEINRAVRNGNVLNRAAEVGKVNILVNIVNEFTYDNLVAFTHVNVAVPGNNFAILNAGNAGNNAIDYSDSYSAVRLVFSIFKNRNGNNLAVGFFVAGRYQIFVCSGNFNNTIFQRSNQFAGFFAVFIDSLANINRQTFAGAFGFNKRRAIDRCSNAAGINVDFEVSRNFNFIFNAFNRRVDNETVNIFARVVRIFREHVGNGFITVIVSFSCQSEFCEVAFRREGFRYTVVSRANFRINLNGAGFIFSRNLNVRDSRNVGEHVNQVNILVSAFNRVDIVAVVDNVLVIARVFNAVKYDNFAIHEVSGNAREHAVNNRSRDAIASRDGEGLAGIAVGFAINFNERRRKSNFTGNGDNAVKQCCCNFSVSVNDNRQASAIAFASRRERNFINRRAASCRNYRVDTFCRDNRFSCAGCVDSERAFKGGAVHCFNVVRRNSSNFIAGFVVGDSFFSYSNLNEIAVVRLIGIFAAVVRAVVIVINRKSRNDSIVFYWELVIVNAIFKVDEVGVEFRIVAANIKDFDNADSFTVAVGRGNRADNLVSAASELEGGIVIQGDNFAFLVETSNAVDNASRDVDSCFAAGNFNGAAAQIFSVRIFFINTHSGRGNRIAVAYDNRAVRQGCSVAVGFSRFFIVFVSFSFRFNGFNRQAVFVSRREDNAVNRRRAGSRNACLERNIESFNGNFVSGNVDFSVAVGCRCRNFREGEVAFLVLRQLREVSSRIVGRIVAVVGDAGCSFVEVDNIVVFINLDVSNAAAEVNEVGVNSFSVVNSVNTVSDKCYFAGFFVNFLNGNDNFIANARVGLAVVDNGFAVVRAGNAGNLAVFNVDNSSDNAVSVFRCFIHTGNHDRIVGSGNYRKFVIDFKDTAVDFRNNAESFFIVFVFGFVCLEGYNNNEICSGVVGIGNCSVGSFANRVFAGRIFSNDVEVVFIIETVELYSITSSRELDISKVIRAEFSRDSVGSSSFVNRDKSRRTVGSVGFASAEDCVVGFSVQRNGVVIVSIFRAIAQLRVVIRHKTFRIENVGLVSCALVNLKGSVDGNFFAGRLASFFVNNLNSASNIYNKATFVHAIGSYIALGVSDSDRAGDIKTSNDRGCGDAFGISRLNSDNDIAVNIVAFTLVNEDNIAASDSNRIARTILNLFSRIRTDKDSAFGKRCAKAGSFINRRFDCQSVVVSAFRYSERNAINGGGISCINRCREVNVNRNGRGIFVDNAGYVNRERRNFFKVVILVNGEDASACRSYVRNILGSIRNKFFSRNRAVVHGRIFCSIFFRRVRQSNGVAGNLHVACAIFKLGNVSCVAIFNCIKVKDLNFSSVCIGLDNYVRDNFAVFVRGYNALIGVAIVFDRFAVIQIGYACNFAVRHCNCHSIRTLGSTFIKGNRTASLIFFRGFANQSSIQFIGNLNRTSGKGRAGIAFAGVGNVKHQYCRGFFLIFASRCNRHVFNAVDNRAASRGNFRVELNVQNNILACRLSVNTDSARYQFIKVVFACFERVDLSSSRSFFFLAAFFAFAAFSRFFSVAFDNCQLSNNAGSFVIRAGAIDNVVEVCFKDNRVKGFVVLQLSVSKSVCRVKVEQIGIRILTFVNLGIFTVSRNNEATVSVHRILGAVEFDNAVKFSASFEVGNRDNLTAFDNNFHAVHIIFNRENVSGICFICAGCRQAGSDNRTSGERRAAFFRFSVISRRNRQGGNFSSFVAIFVDRGNFSRFVLNAINRRAAGSGNRSVEVSFKLNFRAKCNSRIFAQTVASGEFIFSKVFAVSFRVVERCNNRRNRGIDEEHIFSDSGQINRGNIAKLYSFLPRSAVKREVEVCRGFASRMFKTRGILEQNVDNFVCSCVFSFIAFSNVVAFVFFSAAFAGIISNIRFDETETVHGVSAFVVAAFDCEGFFICDMFNRNNRAFLSGNPNETVTASGKGFAFNQFNIDKGYVSNFNRAAVEFAGKRDFFVFAFDCNSLYNCAVVKTIFAFLRYGVVLRAVDCKCAILVESDKYAFGCIADNHVDSSKDKRAVVKCNCRIFISRFNCELASNNEAGIARNIESSACRQSRGRRVFSNLVAVTSNELEDRAFSAGFWVCFVGNLDNDIATGHIRNVSHSAGVVLYCNRNVRSVVNVYRRIFGRDNGEIQRDSAVIDCTEGGSIVESY